MSLILPGPPFRVFSPLRRSFLPKSPFQVCDLSSFLILLIFLFWFDWFLSIWQSISWLHRHAGLSIFVVTGVIAHGSSWLGIPLPLEFGWKDIVLLAQDFLKSTGTILLVVLWGKEGGLPLLKCVLKHATHARRSSYASLCKWIPLSGHSSWSLFVASTAKMPL